MYLPPSSPGSVLGLCQQCELPVRILNIKLLISLYLLAGAGCEQEISHLGIAWLSGPRWRTLCNTITCYNLLRQNICDVTCLIFISNRQTRSCPSAPVTQPSPVQPALVSALPILISPASSLWSSHRQLCLFISGRNFIISAVFKPKQGESGNSFDICLNVSQS